MLNNPSTSSNIPPPKFWSNFKLEPFPDFINSCKPVFNKWCLFQTQFQNLSSENQREWLSFSTIRFIHSINLQEGQGTQKLASTSFLVKNFLNCKDTHNLSVEKLETIGLLKGYYSIVEDISTCVNKHKNLVPKSTHFSFWLKNSIPWKNISLNASQILQGDAKELSHFFYLEPQLVTEINKLLSDNKDFRIRTSRDPKVYAESTIILGPNVSIRNGTKETLIPKSSTETPISNRATETSILNGPQDYPVTTFYPSSDIESRFTQLCQGFNYFISQLSYPKDETEFSNFFWLAGWFAHNFLFIHPFLDGNGRTCLLILNRLFFYLLPMPFFTNKKLVSKASRQDWIQSIHLSRRFGVHDSLPKFFLQNFHQTLLLWDEFYSSVNQEHIPSPLYLKSGTKNDPILPPQSSNCSITVS